MITVAELSALQSTWDISAARHPEDAPAAGYRLWLSAHALVNRRIPIEQAAYLHAEANLYGRQFSQQELAEEYDRTLAALREIEQEPRLLHHLWLALHGWEHYDPTPEAREANRKAKIDRYRQESLLTKLVRAWMMGRLKQRDR
jgi:hypothetical protein